jgi:hypothetical protein
MFKPEVTEFDQSMMKATSFLCLTWVAITGASPLLERRQGFPPNAATQKPLKYKETDGTLKPGSKHVSVVFGPFEIPAGKV